MQNTEVDKFLKRFSLPHYDLIGDDDSFFNALKNSSQSYKDEIRDIYFGGEFIYNHDGSSHRYGETMGAVPSSRKVDNLFRVQDELGVEISLTLNSLNIPPSLISDAKVLDEFINWLNNYYERGLRSCTISSTHLMRTGRLQEAFPEMRWKNTVNHQVKSTQEVYDYAALGYNTILLDRSLNRDVETLKEIKVEAIKLGVETSLLATEGCAPSCPFKNEHDQWQSSISYWSVFTNTCNQWRDGAMLPRAGTDINLATKELVDLYFDNVDILKFSGRLSRPNLSSSSKLCWVAKPLDLISDLKMGFSSEDTENLDCFEDIYNANAAPFIGTRWEKTGFVLEGVVNKVNTYKESDLIWTSKKGKSLAKVLTTCKNRCWDCHACEKVFGVPTYNSLMEIK